MTTVIKIGGASCIDPASVQALATACKQAHGRVIIVHGAGPQLDEALAVHGPPQRIDGLRVTPPAAAATMAEVLDAVGQRLIEELGAHGVQAEQIPSASSILRAVPLDVAGIGRVGRATGVDTLRIPHGITVMGPLGHDDDGPLNVNADTAACAVAEALEADRLVLATDVPHVRGADGEPIASVTPTAADMLIASGVAQGGMIPKLQAGVHALRAGVGEVVIGTVETATSGQGTLIKAVTA